MNVHIFKYHSVMSKEQFLIIEITLSRHAKTSFSKKVREPLEHYRKPLKTSTSILKQ